ncbi:plasmid replication protein RepC [Rhizobium panacihumi]|uniref:plasmid replication protein RepC n=1 Tax=Rhizobium panacihumi TaxID=2008450 RepID=UPI003D7BC6B5
MTSFNRLPALPTPIGDFALRLATKNTSCEDKTPCELARDVAKSQSPASTMNISRATVANGQIGKAVNVRHDSRSRAHVMTLQIVDLQNVFKHLKKIAPTLGLKRGCLNTLEALAFSHRTHKLAFGEPFIVFRSNRSLSERTGSPESTLRDHFKVLIRLGFMSRRDSPNGQRRSPRGRDGDAYGFDLSLLLSRADEFAELARDIEEEERERDHVKRALANCRSTLTKVIEDAMVRNPSEEWQDLTLRFEASWAKRMRNPTLNQLIEKLRETQLLREEAEALWIRSGQAPETGANGSEIQRHIQSTSLESLSEKQGEETPAFNAAARSATAKVISHKGMTVDQICRAYPSLEDYGPSGAIVSPYDFQRAIDTVTKMLQITPKAYDKACEIMGRDNVDITIAYILQLGEQVRSPGAYLHALAKQFQHGDYSPSLTVSKFLVGPRG